MAKLWIVGVLCVAALMQVAFTKDLAAVLDENIREQITHFKQWQKEEQDESLKENLAKVIQLAEGALKLKTAEEKEAALNNAPKQFPSEFNDYMYLKLEELQVNQEISEAIKFYKSLLSGSTPHAEEIKKTIATLENLLKEADLKTKEGTYLNLSKQFSPEFESFLKDTSLPKADEQLKKTSEFFDKLLKDTSHAYGKEVGELKAKVEAALKPGVSLDDKNKALLDVTNVEDKDLYLFLHLKNIQYLR